MNISRRFITMKAKFQLGEQVTANDKAPGDYKGQRGVVLQHLSRSSEYQVQFDGDNRGPGWLSSHMLDRAGMIRRI
jgi:hypothetical protein